MDKISVLIPTIGRSSIQTVLTNLCASDKISEVIISDAGEISIMANIEVVVLLDLLRRKGIRVKVIRELMQGIGKTRYALIEEASSPFALFVDDDCYIDNDSLNLLYASLCSLNVPYIVPCNHIITDFLGVEGLNRDPVFHIEALRMSDGKDWTLPYFNYKTLPDNDTLPIKFCGTQVILFRVADGLKAVELKRWKKGFNREDIYFTKTMGTGMLMTAVVSWHLQNNQQYREWQSMDTKVGYDDVINNRLEAYIE